jgi:4-hydroxybenzoate polyprenyltransferase
MEPHVTANEARAALDSVERGRQQVIDQIALPSWYWFGLALGWIALGVITDLKHPWLTTAGTLLFGAVHSTVAPRVVDGRHRSHQVSVSRDLAGRQTARIVLGGIVVCAFITIGAALAVGGDGARHPVTIASVFVAVIILLGGPQLLAAVRRRAVRNASRDTAR